MDNTLGNLVTWGLMLLIDFQKVATEQQDDGTIEKGCDHFDGSVGVKCAREKQEDQLRDKKKMIAKTYKRLNVHRRLESGRPPKAAAARGGRETADAVARVGAGIQGPVKHHELGGIDEPKSPSARRRKSQQFFLLCLTA
ncbi:Solute Carrier Family 49 Member A3 [Manis pentadactyla]|nr:Solute Carrier Family 49 Member A3 [Manis pentadactyla]